MMHLFKLKYLLQTKVKKKKTSFEFEQKYFDRILRIAISWYSVEKSIVIFPLWSYNVIAVESDFLFRGRISSDIYFRETKKYYNKKRLSITQPFNVSSFVELNLSNFQVSWETE